MKNFVDLVIEKAKQALEENRFQSVSHKWDHVYRVYRRVIKMANEIKGKGVDLEILKISALLHDIDQPYNRKQSHVKRSLSKAEQILKEIGYPKEKIKKVLSIISEHSSEDEKGPTSIEAKILYDADKLDGVGAIGIARVFAFCGQNGLIPKEAIEWYRRKIEK
ncbi:MAG TPA: HD domain-containing protein, partial [Candidatus Aenigmarchaeota archaeon]|nr:HD domain-containing protein [Candidatus Aenigmarchaeota archaeon]